MNYQKKIILFIALVILTSCHRNKDKEVLIIPVEIKEINLQTDTLYQNYIGKIEEEYASSLSFSVPGNIEEVYVNEGEYVNKGKLLATLNKENLQSTHDAALASLKQAEDAYQRLNQLHEKGSIPEIQWIEMLTNLEKARSTEKIAKKNLSEGNLYAPYNGVIGKKNVEKGMFVLPTMYAFTLLSTKNIVVKVPIPENIISSIHAGQKAKVSVAALNNQHFEGKVDMKGILANPISHSYDISIPLQNNNKQLMPGMICNVQFISEDTTKVVILPVQAVKLSHTGEQYVWLAENDKATKRIVKTGALTDFGIVIQEGLHQNDKVIIKGYQKVSEGTQITIQ